MHLMDPTPGKKSFFLNSKVKQILKQGCSLYDYTHYYYYYYYYLILYIIYYKEQINSQKQTTDDKLNLKVQ